MFRSDCSAKKNQMSIWISMLFKKKYVHDSGNREHKIVSAPATINSPSMMFEQSNKIWRKIKDFLQL